MARRAGREQRWAALPWPPLLSLQHASCTGAVCTMPRSCSGDSRRLCLHVSCSRATMVVARMWHCALAHVSYMQAAAQCRGAKPCL